MRKDYGEVALWLSCRATELLDDGVFFEGVLKIAFDPTGPSNGQTIVEANVNGEVCNIANLNSSCTKGLDSSSRHLRW